MPPRYSIIGGLMLLISGCMSTQPPLSTTLPTPLRSPIKPTQTYEQLSQAQQAAQEPHVRFQATPTAPTATSTSAHLEETAFVPQFASGTPPLKVNIEGLPLPAFINEVFGNLLALSFEMLPVIQQKRDLVTLRVIKPQKPIELYHLARQVLLNYGVAIQKLPGDAFIRFVPAGDQQLIPPSLIVSGLALPEVPPTHRPIFQFIPLKAVEHNQIIPWLKKIYQGYQLEMLPDESRNAIILLGTPQLVTQAADVVNVLDQPLMQGQYSIRIEPAFLSAGTLASRLTQVLQSQGYSMAGIHLLPIDETNSIIAFAREAQMLEYIQQWSEQLDRFNPQQTEKVGIFFYGVKNTAAGPLAETLNDLLADIVEDTVTTAPKAAAVQKTAKKAAGKGKATPAKPTPSKVKSSTEKTVFSAKLSVDEHRNGLLFVGTGEQWARLLPILQEMDKPAKQVLIEATIAEIMLTETDDRGIEWVINKANLGGLEGRLGTLGGLSIRSGSGLTYTLSNAGQARAVLNAFATSSRVTVLQTPRLLVRSGSTASMSVGDEIPILTSQGVSNLQTGGNSSILQQIQYRGTGISLNITPVVYAGRRIDLAISQQVSSSKDNPNSSIGSPIISNRQINTELTLSDGHSVLLGGIISKDRTDGWNGIPILSDIPLIGQLFRVDRISNTRSELVVMIIPYVIDNEEEASAISEAVKQRLTLLPVNTTDASYHDKPLVR